MKLLIWSSFLILVLLWTGMAMVGPWLPSPDTLGSLMSLLVWVAWGVGALLLLALAVGAHWLSGRRLS